MLTAFATLAAAVGVIFAYFQLRRDAREEERATRVREAQRALDLMRPLIELERVVVDHPQLGPYFQNFDGPIRELMPDVGDDLRTRVLAHATAYVNHAEAVGWQSRAMGAAGRTAWNVFFRDLYEKNPTIRTVVAAMKNVLSEDTHALFDGNLKGQAEPTGRLAGATIEASIMLIVLFFVLVAAVVGWVVGYNMA